MPKRKASSTSKELKSPKKEKSLKEDVIDEEGVDAQSESHLISKELSKLCPGISQELAEKAQSTIAISLNKYANVESFNIDGTLETFQELKKCSKLQKYSFNREISSIFQLKLQCLMVEVTQCGFVETLKQGLIFGNAQMKNWFKSGEDNPTILEYFMVMRKISFKVGEDNETWLVNKTVWNDLFKVILKYGLKSEEDNVKLMATKFLSLLLSKTVIPSTVSKELKEESQRMSEMLFGHSQFLPLLLAPSSSLTKLKLELVRLIHALMDLNPSVCTAGNLAIFLGAYEGSMSSKDQELLRLIYRFAHYDPGALAQFHPILWGPGAVKHYAVKKKDDGSSALWKRPKVSEVLSLIDNDKMQRTAIHYPRSLAMNSHKEGIDDTTVNESIYDPRFFLPLCCHLCSPGMFVDRHLKLIESGILALAFSALSSYDLVTRKAGYLLLSRIYGQLESAKLTSEKRIWLQLLDLIRNSVRETKKGTDLRIPSVVVVFLIRATEILRYPLDSMYKTISGFLLAKPVLDLFNVPEFLRLFHSKKSNFLKERNWIIKVLRDGMDDEKDYQIAKKSFAFKILMTFGQSRLCDKDTRNLILMVILKTVRLTQPSFDLVREQGLIPWLVEISQSEDIESLELISKVTLTALSTMKKSLPSGVDLPVPILNDFLVLNAVIQAKAFPGTTKSKMKSLIFEKLSV